MTTSSKNPHLPRWLEWAREIQALAQTGLAYSASVHDTQRYLRLMEIAAKIMETVNAARKAKKRADRARRPDGPGANIEW